MLDPVSPTPKNMALYERLRTALADEEFPPGMRISEVDLCARFEVSRTRSARQWPGWSRTA